MFNLATDARTAEAYAAASVRANADSNVGLPGATGAPVTLMLQTLTPQETARWISWAYELRPGPVIWWIVALTTENRLVGVGGNSTPTYWAAPVGTWTVSSADTDCVLHMPGGAPLRVRGSATAASLFNGLPLSGEPTTSVTGESHDKHVVGSWQEAEALAAWHMKKLGFDDAQLTAAGADGGLDVVAKSAVAQVKHYSGSPIGAPAIQQLRGAGVGFDWALFYSLSGYTRAAMDFAGSADVALFTYDTNGAVEPVSAAATHLMDRAGLDAAPSIDEFTLQQEANKLGQLLFDAAWKSYLKTAERVLQYAKPKSPQTRALRSENDAVKGVVAYADSRGAMKMSEFLVIVDQIEAARKRLEQHLP